MNQLVYVFGEDYHSLLMKFSREGLYFHDWPVKDVLEQLRMRGRLNASMEMMEVLDEQSLLQLILDQVKGATRIMIVGNDVSMSDMQTAQTLGVGVIIRIDETGTTRWVSHWSTDDWNLNWYVVGGQWSHRLQPKPGASPPVYLGENSYHAMQCMTERLMRSQSDPRILGTEFVFPEVGAPFPVEKGRNMLRKSEIDFEAMKLAARKGRAELWTSVRGLIELDGFIDMRDLLSVEDGIDHAESLELGQSRSTPDLVRLLAIKEYQKWPGAMDALEALREWHRDLPGHTGQEDLMLFSEELDMIAQLELNEYLDLKGFKAYLPDAFIVEGEWHTRDSFLDLSGRDRFGLDRWRMWADTFDEIYDQLPDDILVTVANCYY